ncbi:hypothetical protein DPSP01_013134 [Paraphaeosphaeria sporulosa]
MYPRLAPEDDFSGMLEGCNEFATCFEAPNFPKVEAEIKKLFPTMKATLQDQFFAISDSAGALWSVITLLSHPGVNIRSGELWCPMAGLYRRKLGPYRGVNISAKQATDSGLNWLDDASRIRPGHRPGRGRTPPLGMGVLAVNATWTYCKDGDELKPVPLLEVLTRYFSILELANMVDASNYYHDVGKDMVFDPNLLVEPVRIFERLGERMNNIGVRYLPEMDALEFIKERSLPQLYPPRKPLRLAIVHGTEDVNCPFENAEQLAMFFQRVGADVRFEKVQGAPHAFDVPTADSGTGRKYDFDYEEMHQWSAAPMEWNEMAV